MRRNPARAIRFDSFRSPTRLTTERYDTGTEKHRLPNAAYSVVRDRACYGETARPTDLPARIVRYTGSYHSKGLRETASAAVPVSTTAAAAGLRWARPISNCCL